MAFKNSKLLQEIWCGIWSTKSKNVYWIIEQSLVFTQVLKSLCWHWKGMSAFATYIAEVAISDRKVPTNAIRH